MNNGKIEQIGSPEEVYEHPNSPFVYDFLGNVNLFKGRLYNGKLKHRNLEISVSEELQDRTHDHAVAYVRPHDIQIDKEQITPDSILVTINHIHLVGSLVQVELHSADGEEYYEAELSKEQYKLLQIKKGDTVFVSPKQLKVFIPEDFSIKPARCILRRVFLHLLISAIDCPP